MIDYWNALEHAFIIGFCKVDFLCYAGAPNWLGSAVLGLGGIVVVGYLSWLCEVIFGGRS